MSDNKVSKLKILDSAIYVFIVIFLLSISNSIFVNQIGYYGALILILIRAAITKQNQFSKTGLEFAIVWYILAEVLSTIFSSKQPASFHNLLKHILLIPIIYTTIAAIRDYNEAKKYFKIYIGATLVTVLIYLYFSFQYYLNNLYSATASGPSIFQFPITASEIISFTVIFLFTFLINEKTTLKNKILLLAAFSLSALALFSTYKRTGWLGAAFGILVVLILKKQWKLLSAGAVLILLFFITQKNISEINFYKIESNNIKYISTLPTSGKASDIYKMQEQMVVADYNNGLSIFKKDSVQQKLIFPSAVTGFYHWKDDYYLAGLADTRYILLEKKQDKFKIKGELYSPGYTFTQAVGNGFLYILDNDSGLTVFTDPGDLNNKYRTNSFSTFTNMFVDTSFIIFADASKGFFIYSIKDGLPDGRLVAKDSSAITFFYYSSPNVFTANENGLNIYSVSDSGVKLVQIIPSINNIFKMKSDAGQYIAANTSGDIFLLQQNLENEFVITAKLKLSYVPQNISIQNNNIFICHVEGKQSRLLDIFDPYHPSNANRISFWRAGIKIFQDNPIFGVGDIDLQDHYRLYKRPYDKEIQGHLHNNLFHVLATLGLFGLLAVIFLFVKIILINIKIYNSTKDKPFISSYALGTLAAFGGFLISGLTELNFWDHEITTLIWFTFGLNIALFKSFKPEKIL